MRLLRFDENDKRLPDEILPDGEIRFDPATYHFFHGDRDITNDIPRSEKLRTIPGFDIERENIRLSNELGAQTGLGDEPLNESTLKEFGKQILTDPLGAPMESLSNVADKFFKLPGIQKILIAAVVGTVLYIAAKKA